MTCFLNTPKFLKSFTGKVKPSGRKTEVFAQMDLRSKEVPKLYCSYFGRKQKKNYLFPEQNIYCLPFCSRTDE